MSLPEMKEVRLASLPGYANWSSQPRQEYPEAFAVLDGMMTLIPADALEGPHEELFQELYEEVLSDFGLDEGDEARFELDD